MDKGYLVVFDDAVNYKAKAYDIDSDVKEDDAKKLAIVIILLKLTNHSDYADQLFRYP